MLKKLLKEDNKLYLIILATIIITRLGVFLIPEVDIKMGSIIIHHFWFGIIFFLIGLLIMVKYKKTKMLFLGVGFGLIIDQLIFMVLGGGKDLEYWAFFPVLGTVILLVLLFLFKDRILAWELKHGLNLKKYFVK